MDTSWPRPNFTLKLVRPGLAVDQGHQRRFVADDAVELSAVFFAGGLAIAEESGVGLVVFPGL